MSVTVPASIVWWNLPLVSPPPLALSTVLTDYYANILTADASSTVFQLYCPSCHDTLTSTMTIGPWAEVTALATASTGELNVQWTRMWETELLTLTGAGLNQPVPTQTDTAALRPNVISIHCGLTSTTVVDTCVLQMTTSVGPTPTTYPPQTLPHAAVNVPFNNVWIHVVSGYDYIQALSTPTSSASWGTSLSWPSSDQVPSGQPTGTTATSATAGGTYSLLTAASNTATTTARSASSAGTYSAASRTSVLGLLGVVVASLLFL